ncbi:MAG TPA: heme exporter protein CcmD [Burkholderiales bacterium]|nr:heme exporter protein CcmD [Burkholderiales bacterium]
MQWASASEFFAMGGSALYVWGAYGMTMLIVAIELVGLRRRARTLREAAGRNAQAHSD